ncbi:Vacuolar protein sorting-associated protein 13B [Holothuria leucospilota]|uniref:Vacuolar protein sorting-associated protein 13B n=1 Tax=Holothuria leucospilota TaxID=206669 RepID=A0A9Q0YTJ0_HOLLE|nr:Vacuolar protein sorting-associated protein 13B [Holothuria leucospilota]
MSHFLIEYLSSYLKRYVQKYIKSIMPKNLEVWLRKGDLVMKKLDLRLDVLEKELPHLPISFVSGHIHKLEIHIPWTKLFSKIAVEITINTIEFVVKLKHGASSDGKSQSIVSSQIKKYCSGTGSKCTPGYIQSFKRRVVNNAHIVIKNLILKYVEEDTVLSVNVKSVESYATDADWKRACVDLSPSELVLRRLCTFSDITVCLDKCNASGKIEVYQEPVICHWNLTTCIHMTFKNLAANAASVIKLSTFCDELNLSLSETRLPMYIRLVQLVLALYYGSLDLPETRTGNLEKESEETSHKEDAAVGNVYIERLIKGNHQQIQNNVYNLWLLTQILKPHQIC